MHNRNKQKTTNHRGQGTEDCRPGKAGQITLEQDQHTDSCIMMILQHKPL